MFEKVLRKGGRTHWKELIDYDNKPQIKAIYVAVRNMERAIKFYEEILKVKISSKDERMSSFQLDNITFLLFNPNVDGEKVSTGDNVIPCIEVENINEMLKLIKRKGCEVVMPIKKIENYVLFQAKDTEGNTIEFYQTEK